MVYFLTERMRLSLSLHPQLSVIPHFANNFASDTCCAFKGAQMEDECLGIDFFDLLSLQISSLPLGACLNEASLAWNLRNPDDLCDPVESE